MSDTKILQSILDSQVLIRKDIKQLEEKVDGGFEKVHGRIDKLGLLLTRFSFLLAKQDAGTSQPALAMPKALLAGKLCLALLKPCAKEGQELLSY